MLDQHYHANSLARKQRQVGTNIKFKLLNFVKHIFRWEGKCVSGRSSESSSPTHYWLQDLSAEEILGWPCSRFHDLCWVQRHWGPTCCMPGTTGIYQVGGKVMSVTEIFHLSNDHPSPSSSSRETLVVLCCASWGGTAGRCMAWWALAPLAALWRTNPAFSPAPPPTSRGLRQHESETSSCTKRARNISCFTLDVYRLQTVLCTSPTTTSRCKYMFWMCNNCFTLYFTTYSMHCSNFEL